MKKIISFLLVIAAMISLSGCGEGKAEEGKSFCICVTGSRIENVVV